MDLNIRKRSKGFKAYYTILIIFFVFLGFTMVFPLYNVIVTSFATLGEITASPLMIFPSKPTLMNYQYLVMDGGIVKAYGVTIFTTVVGTALSLFFTLLLAYGLSKKELPGSHLLHRILVVTMFIDSGLIPYYMMVKSLGMMNSVWSSIIPCLISLWNYLVIRSFFIQLPKDLEEAAMIDGASYGRLFLQIVVPLSTPVIATFALYYAVDYWNSWYNCMLFNRDEGLQLLQLYVYRMVQRSNIQFNSTAAAFKQQFGEQAMNEPGLKAAACTAAVVPILCVYPFLQKYFAKGVMLGAIKG